MFYYLQSSLFSCLNGILTPIYLYWFTISREQWDRGRHKEKNILGKGNTMRQKNSMLFAENYGHCRKKRSKGRLVRGREVFLYVPLHQKCKLHKYLWWQWVKKYKVHTCKLKAINIRARDTAHLESMYKALCSISQGWEWKQGKKWKWLRYDLSYSYF